MRPKPVPWASLEEPAEHLGERIHGIYRRKWARRTLDHWGACIREFMMLDVDGWGCFGKVAAKDPS